MPRRAWTAQGINMLYGINGLKKFVSNIETSSDKCYYPADGRNICFVDETGGVPLIRFTPLKKYDWINLAFSTRLGGTSKGYFSSLNLGFNNGDNRKNVIENYKRVCKAFNCDYKDLVFSDQVHGTKVQYVDQAYTAGEGLEKKLTATDGMVTDVPGIALVTSFADCVPLFFVDPVHKAIGSSHSGWRGTVGFIGDKTVKKMQSQFNSRPEDIICIIGPSICQECYEVSRDVIEEVKKAWPGNVWKDIFYCSDKKEGKYKLDLWAANYHQLLLSGLKKENIHVAGLCTCCGSQVLFSHRASGGKRGNLSGFMLLFTDKCHLGTVNN